LPENAHENSSLSVCQGQGIPFFLPLQAPHAGIGIARNPCRAGRSMPKSWSGVTVPKRSVQYMSGYRARQERGPTKSSAPRRNFWRGPA